MPKKQVIGVVVSDKCDKTRRVEINRLVRHPKYGKHVTLASKYQVHDEANESHNGDRVEIQLGRPMSKTKSWKLVRIVEKAPGSEVVTQNPEEVIASTQTAEN